MLSVEISHPKEPVFYMPIQGVVKESSTTTKMRAVFDVSAKSSTGVALNDLLLAGPTLHPMLPDILLKFHQHKIACTADVGKMFWEISLHPDERDLHRFLSRRKDGQMEDCRMKKVTFGVRSSPFLATRVIRALADECERTHSLASQAVRTCFYVDDFMSGAESVEKADVLRQQLCSLFSLTGMNLRKWRSNSQDLRDTIPHDLLETTGLNLPAPLSSPKALGMHWDVSQDNLHVAVPIPSQDANVTKRQVASQSAQVYDVLGLFSPVTIVPKIILQEAWKANTPWDKPVPESAAKRWNSWTSELQAISKKPVPRRINTSKKPVIFHLIHGFADASTAAYGAVAYMRMVHEDTSVTTSLIYSKSRVAPVKTARIPRLELLAAQLLAKVLSYVSKMYDVLADEIFAWTDSEIVLYWLCRPPAAWKTFVSHRVAEIQQAVSSNKWHHVWSQDNPADLISHGVQPKALADSALWLDRPDWLRQQPEKLPTQKIMTPKRIPEVKIPSLSVTVTSTPDPFWSKYSSYSHLTRITAWMRRFLRNCRTPYKCITEDVLTTDELRQVKTQLLRVSQKETYPEVFEWITSGKEIPKSHPLRPYCVFIVKDCLIHITGRVRKKGDKKAPRDLIPLSLKSPITRLFVSSQHHEQFHSNVPSLLCVLAESYHIPGFKRHLKYMSCRCVICQKAYSKPLVQSMGLLPSQRTTPSPPFNTTGIDFAGPFQIRQGHTQRPVILKAYICVFVCFSTKAIHLELCADLTTPEFMAALQRFVAR